jgi:hypothetical protein
VPGQGVAPSTSKNSEWGKFDLFTAKPAALVHGCNKQLALMLKVKITGRRVGEDVATLTPHRTGRADFPLPVLHGRASLTQV